MLRSQKPGCVKADGQGDAGIGAGIPDVVLQTQTIPTEQALLGWSNWKASTEVKISALVERKQTLRPVVEHDIQQMGRQGIDHPSFHETRLTRKAVSGRRKCRIVLCSNAAPTVGETMVERKLATYAGGFDLGVLRMLLAEAVVQDYQITSFDVGCSRNALVGCPCRLRQGHLSS